MQVLVLFAALAAQPADDTAALLDKAKAIYQSMEFDQVIPLAREILAREDIDIDQRLDAQVLLGSAYAIVGNQLEAEKAFRYLLRGRPDYDMPPDASPKIVAVFRKVQVEERTIREQMRELELRRAVSELVLSGDRPAEVRGGDPIEFEYRLKDPRAIVSEIHVRYRKAGEPSYSALALIRDDIGIWRGKIPGEWTENDDGLRVESFLSTMDEDGRTLLAEGGPKAPHVIEVEPGYRRPPPQFYETAWFWAAVAGVAALGATSVIVLARGDSLPESDLGTVTIRD